jgi:hypothetical protein
MILRRGYECMGNPAKSKWNKSLRIGGRFLGTLRPLLQI